MASLGQLNSDVEAKATDTGGGGITTLPDDVYELEIFESEVKTASTGKGMNLDFKVRVLSGPFKDVWFFDGIPCIQHESAAAMAGGQGRLRALAEACDQVWPLPGEDSEAVHFRPFHAQVIAETYFSKKHSKEMTKNKIVKFLYGDLEPDVLPPSAPPVRSQPTQQQAAPQQQAAAPAANAPAKRVWQRST
jgi:hypothetical protein